MTNILFSIAISVSLLILIFVMLKNRIIRKYGFSMIYSVSLILAIRLVIPYSFQFPSINIAAIHIPNFVMPIWIIGTIISLAYQLCEYFYFSKQLKRYSRPVLDDEIKLIYEQVKLDMFIDADIPVRFSSKADTPMLKGILKPEIILTDSDYTANEYRMIFHHELTHYSNRDNLKKFFFMLVLSFQWFNPFVYVLEENLNESIECLCDEKVIRNKSSEFKRDYSLMLLKTVKVRSIPMVSGLSAKEKLKMRIGNIFDSGKKKSAVIPSVAVTLCAVMLSSFFCSCTVAVPDDVREEMNRIENGISNEKNADELAEESGLKLKPVSEVTANAESEIAELSSVDGIFKLDDANIIIPQKDEIEIYERTLNIGSPKEIYEQVKYLEEEWLGYCYPDESHTAAVGFFTGDTENYNITLEEFLKGSQPAAIYISSENKEHGSVDNMVYGMVLWYTPLLTEINEMSEDWECNEPDNIFKCLNADEEMLSHKFKLYDGEITLKEVIQNAESYMNNFKFTIDNKLKYKVEAVREYKINDEISVLDLSLRIFCGDVPFNFTYCDISSPKPFGTTEYNGTDTMYMKTAHCGGYDYIYTFSSNMTYTQKGTVKEIISLTDAFSILKNTVSNATVYDIDEVSLGNIVVSYDECDNYWDKEIETMPVWTFRLKNKPNELIATINAVTGEIHTCID